MALLIFLPKNNSLPKVNHRLVLQGNNSGKEKLLPLLQMICIFSIVENTTTMFDEFWVHF
jgi:hypothetical protein